MVCLLACVEVHVATMPASRWSNEAIEILIDFMKDHEELWKTSSVKYHNKALKTAAADNVLNLLKEHVEEATTSEVFKRVANLKAQFSRERRKQATSAKSGAGVADLEISTWWAYEKLHFLTEGEVNEASYSNMSAQSSQNVSCHIRNNDKILFSFHAHIISELSLDCLVVRVVFAF